MKHLPKDLSARIAVRLQAALNEVGACVDDLHLNAPSIPKSTHTQWVLTVDKVQKQLLELTLFASRGARK